MVFVVRLVTGSVSRHTGCGLIAPLWLCVILLATCMAPAYADLLPRDRKIERYHGLVQAFFPTVDRLGVLEGDPPAAAVIQDGQVTGYLFFTDEILPIPAYSGKPISTLVGINRKGVIAGVRIVHHLEPILLAGISEERLKEYVDQYQGLDTGNRIKIGGTSREGETNIDGISGATITAMVINQSITRSAQEVVASRGLSEEIDASTDDEALENARPLWKFIWEDRQFQITILMISLGFLILILLFQDWLATHPRLLLYVRDLYLVFTVVFIGWYGLAQLSVVNVFTFVHSAVHDFHWQTFLIDPLMFILWSFVAVTLLLWGRGVYCGWLCPFGALQELINQLARRFRVRQWEFPDMVHERLWAVKYIVLLVLFGISLESLQTAEYYAEVEPFKTVFTLHFQREWSYMSYAIALLTVAMINRKFYCKYLCPLGAALAIPARQRLFDWLRRRRECGKPCQVCANECEVRAISPTGEINANECHYCLDCQVTYWNQKKCPPLVQKLRRREKATRPSLQGHDPG